ERVGDDIGERAARSEQRDRDAREPSAAQNQNNSEDTSPPSNRSHGFLRWLKERLHGRPRGRFCQKGERGITRLHAAARAARDRKGLPRSARARFGVLRPRKG